LRMRTNPHIYFAGQITGSEGYVESVATGLFASVNMAGSCGKENMMEFSQSTAIGGLINYLTNPDNVRDFQPMNINFGLIRDPEGKFKRKERRAEKVKKALFEIEEKLLLIS